ncbi:MAG: FHA domain-containing protein [Bdellovibrionaceae bacterium]|nr:FHA domain-containing protein [Bdellovibrio sp.]
MSAAVQQKPQLSVKLSVVKGPHAGQVFQLAKSEVSIGRGPENDIVLLNDPQVSRAHAKIILVDRDFEIINLSKKNAVFVNGENVERWKLVNHETFFIGDTEFKIEYDLGQAVASVAPKKLATVVQLKPKPGAKPVSALKPSMVPMGPAAQPSAIATRPRQGPVPFKPIPVPLNRMALGAQSIPRPPTAAQSSLLQHPKFKFYAIVSIALGAFLYFMLAPAKNAVSAKPRPTLKYEDEVSIKLNSTPEKELVQKRFELKKEKNSPQHQRAEENFIKGMRDFQLGNYARAMDFYQVVLNLEPEHNLARRHYYLSKVRFDELIQAKLMLGESYYKKHNFSMCESMYRQVMDMLGDKNTDNPKYLLARSKVQECNLAAEGIR